MLDVTKFLRLYDYVIVCADAKKVVNSLPFGLKGIVITDPPYPELEPHRAIGTTTRLVKKWFPTLTWNEIKEVFKSLFARFYECHVYIWGNSHSIFKAKEIVESLGLKFWNIIVWHKQKLGLGYHYRNSLEYVLFFEKGKRKLNDLRLSNFFSEKISNELLKMHPAAKPINMQMKLIANSAKDNDIVIDPFMGIGTTLIATFKARQNYGMNVKYIGIEIEKEYVMNAKKLARNYGIQNICVVML